MDETNSDEWLKNLPVQAENIAFRPEEMISCAKCQRANPPNRLNCFYCGGELVIPEEQKRFLKLKLRKLESWEKGCNVILLPDSQSPDEEKIASAAKLLATEKEIELPCGK